MDYWAESIYMQYSFNPKKHYNIDLIVGMYVWFIESMTHELILWLPEHMSLYEMITTTTTTTTTTTITTTTTTTTTITTNTITSTTTTTAGAAINSSSI